jgi:hypothetical protein
MDDDREADVERRLLGQVGDLPAVHAVQFDAALQRTQFAGDALEQRRLAGTVRADDGQQAAGRHFAAQVVHRRVPVVTQRQVVKTHDCRCAHSGWPGHGQSSVQSRAQSTVVHSSSSAPAAQSSRAAALAQSTGLACGFLAEWRGGTTEGIGLSASAVGGGVDEERGSCLVRHPNATLLRNVAGFPALPAASRPTRSAGVVGGRSTLGTDFPNRAAASPSQRFPAR